MSNTNTPNGTTQSAEKQKKRDNYDMNNLCDDYFKDKKGINSKDKTRFLNDIKTRDEVSKEMYNEMEVIWEKNGNGNLKFQGHIDIHSIKKRFKTELFNLDTTKENFEIFFCFNYEQKNKNNGVKITKELYDLKIEPKLMHLSIEEMNDFIKDPKKRDKLLKVLLGTTADKFILKEDKEDDEFWNNFPNAFKEKINKYKDTNSEKAEEIASILNTIQYNHFKIHEAKRLIELGVFPLEDMHRFIGNYIQVVGLSDIKKYIKKDDFKKIIQKKLSTQGIIDNNEIDNICSDLWLGNPEINLHIGDIISSITDQANFCADMFLKSIQPTIDDLVSNKRSIQNFEQLKIKIGRDEALIIENVENLNEGAFLFMNTVTGNGSKEFSALEILSVDGTQNSGGPKGLYYRTFVVEKDNDGKIQKMTTTDTQSYGGYDTFFNVLKSTISELRVESGSHINDQVESGKITQIVHKQGNKRSQESVDNEKKDITRELSELEAILLSKGISNTEVKDNDEYKILIDKYNKLENQDIDALEEEINFLDNDGIQFGLMPGTAFVVPKTKGDKIGLFQIRSINKEEQMISLTSGEEISFLAFGQAFHENEAKRYANFNGLEGLTNALASGKDMDVWKNYKILNDKIRHKDNEDEGPEANVEYFMSKKTENFIKIDKINDNRVVCQFGDKLQKKNSKNEVERDKDGKITFSYTVGPKQILSLSQFYYFIDDWGLEPEDSYTKPEVQHDHDRKGSLMSYFANKKSFFELFQGGKIGLDAMEGMLEDGSNVHASKAALGMFGWLGDEIGYNLKSRVQGEEIKKQDEVMGRLKDLDSPEATRLIEIWLHNKNCPQYKLEAAVMFMYKEYGSLYTKGPLAGYRGTNLWYKALGGTPGDKPWNDARDSCKDEETGNPMPFTEEEAVYKLVKKQCKGGYNGITRQSRLHKQIKGSWPGGVEEEVNKGYGGAKDTRALSDINAAGVDELKDGTMANFVGWCKKASERGGELHEVYRMPAIAMFSGAIYNFDQRIISSHMKDMYKDGSASAMIPFEFTSNVESMDLFNDSMLEISNMLSSSGDEKYNGMYSQAKKIHSNMRVNNANNVAGRNFKEGDLQKRIKQTSLFWDQYGKDITKIMFMTHNNASGTGKDAKLDNFMLLEMQKKPPNRTLEKFYNVVREIGKGADGGYKYDNKALMTDYMGGAGASGMYLEKATEVFLAYSGTYGLKERTMAKIFFNKELIPGIESVKQSDMSLSDKKIILFEKYKSIISGVYAAETARSAKGDDDLLKEKRSLLNSDNLTINGFKKIGIAGIDKESGFNRASGEDINALDINNDGHPMVKELLARIDSFLEGTLDGGNSLGPIEQLMQGTQKVTTNIQNSDEASNDNLHNHDKKAA